MAWEITVLLLTCCQTPPQIKEQNDLIYTIDGLSLIVSIVCTMVSCCPLSMYGSVNICKPAVFTCFIVHYNPFVYTSWSCSVFDANYYLSVKSMISLEPRCVSISNLYPLHLDKILFDESGAF